MQTDPQEFSDRFEAQIKRVNKKLEQQADKIKGLEKEL